MEAEATFLAELGLLLLLLGIAGAIAWRVGLSAAPLFLIAGLFVGDGGVFPAEAARGFLDAAAAVGVVLLLLTLGLEYSAQEFGVALRRHTPSGLVDFALNASPGFIFGLLMGWTITACVAMAGITWVTSSGIVSKVLGDMGRLGNRETPAVLSVLVLEDIAMAAYLPLLSVLLIGGGVSEGVGGAALSMAVVATILLLARRAEPVLERLILHEDDEQVLLRVLGLTLLVAGVAAQLGISSAVGAFLVGLAIPTQTARRARGILQPLRDLFAAAFFLAFGAETDVGSLLPVMPQALALAAIGLVTKLLTGWYAAAREGVATRGRVRAGTVLMARGEFSVVIAGMAVAAGLTDVGPVATAFVLVVAVVGPIFARFSDGLTGLFQRPTTPLAT